MNKISNERKTQIKSIVLNLLKEYKNVYLPMPVKSIAKSLRNCRVIPYSTMLKKFNLNKSDIPKLFNSNDACSDYDSNNDRYIIYYNDTDESIMNSNRYRWNIAHELGHILLKHHQNENTRLFRNSLSQQEYSIFEYEANIFAAYLLVPHVILYFQGVHSCSDIARLCKISQSASQTRYSEYMYWLKNSKFVDKYDKELQILFHKSTKTQKQIFCVHCKTNIGYNKGYQFCYICKNQKTRYIIEGEDMVYDSIEVDANGKAITCPVCDNEDLSYGDYCNVCGAYVINKCTSNESDPDSVCVKSIQNPLTGNARYCPYCGSRSTFLNLGYLKDWQSIKNPNNIEVFELQSDDELPF